MSEGQAEGGFKLMPWHFSGSDCAAILGIAKSSFSERGYEPEGQRGRVKYYDIRAAIRSDILRGVIEADDGEVIDHEAEKAKWTKARRIAQEFENAELEGRLRPVEEVEEAVIAALVPVADMLDALPMAIKRDCPELSARGVEKVERTIATARNALADDHIDPLQDKAA